MVSAERATWRPLAYLVVLILAAMLAGCGSPARQPGLYTGPTITMQVERIAPPGQDQTASPGRPASPTGPETSPTLVQRERTAQDEPRQTASPAPLLTSPTAVAQIVEQPWNPAVLVQLPSDQFRLSGVAADDEALYRSTCKRNGFAGPGEVHMMPKGGGAARLLASLSAAPAKGRRCRDGAA